MFVIERNRRHERPTILEPFEEDAIDSSDTSEVEREADRVEQSTTPKTPVILVFVPFDGANPWGLPVGAGNRVWRARAAAR